MLQSFILVSKVLYKNCCRDHCKNNFRNIDQLYKNCGPGSIVGIATGYSLDSPGIEYRWGRDFPHLSRPALGSTQPPAQWVLVLSQG